MAELLAFGVKSYFVVVPVNSNWKQELYCHRCCSSSPLPPSGLNIQIRKPNSIRKKQI